MISKAIQIRDIQTFPTSLTAVAIEWTRALPVVPTLPMPTGVGGWPLGAGPECLAVANPYRGSLGCHFDRAA